MSLIPVFQIDFWTGWRFSVVIVIFYLGMFLTFPAELSTRFGVGQNLGAISRLSNIFFGAPILIAAFTPLKLNTLWLWVGAGLFISGIVGSCIALYYYSYAPANRFVTKGIYRFSRNPVYVLSYIITLGIGIATASWLIILCVICQIAVMRRIIKAEDSYCLEKYGDSYREYMEDIPRYFIFF